MIILIVFSLSVYVAATLPSPNAQLGANIDSSVDVGKHTKIGDSVTIKAHSRVGNYAKIDGPTTIGENCQIGNYAEIAKGCTLANEVTVSKHAHISSDVQIGTKSVIGDYAELGPNVKIMNKANVNRYAKISDAAEIHDESIIGDYAKVGSKVNIANRVKVNEYANIGDGAEIKDDSLLDDYSKNGANMKAAQKVYIGRYAFVPASANINELAILHKYVDLPDGYTVKKNEVVIRSPTSYEMYKECASSANIPKDQVQIANTRGSGPSKQFNDMMRELLDPKINDVKGKCGNGNRVTKPDMTTARSLFLIQRYGLDRFKQCYAKVQGANSVNIVHGDATINGFKIPADYHFGKDGENDIFEPDTKKKFIQLLEIEIDADRGSRVVNDIFCPTTAQILSDEREVTVAIPSHHSSSNVHYNSLILILSTSLISVNWHL